MIQSNNKITKRASLDVGRFVAKSAARELRKYLHNTGLEYSVTEDMSWIDGYIYISVSGEETDVLKAMKSIGAWCDSQR